MCGNLTIAVSCGYEGDTNGLGGTLELTAVAGSETSILLVAEDADLCSAGGRACPEDPPYVGPCGLDPLAYEIPGGPLGFEWDGPGSAVRGTDCCEGGCATSTYYVTYNKPGAYVVTCTVVDENTGDAHDDNVTTTFNITVKPAKPDCSDFPPPSACNSGGGCSPCVSGSGAPSVSLYKQEVLIPDPVSAGPVTGMGGFGSSACTKETYTVYDTCNGLWGIFKDRCGYCTLVNVDEGGEPEYPGFRRVANGVSIVAIKGAGGVTTLTATYPDGSVSQFSLPPASNFTTHTAGPQGPSTITDPNGNVTQLNWNSAGGIDSVTTATGGTWTYGHTGGDSRITSITAPDGIYTEVSYVQAGAAEGKVETVTTYTDDTKAETQSTVDYGYDEDGRIESYTANNGVETEYTYDTDSITVTEQSEGVSSAPFAVTEYDYSAGQASNETWVTRWADPAEASPGEDQKTIYTFDSTGRNIGSVTDPSGDKTEYQYDGSGRVLLATGGGLTTSYVYNDKGNITSVSVWDDGQTMFRSETYSYDSSGAWLTMRYDAQGNWTRYIRNTENPNLVDAIEAFAGSQGFTTIKSFTYYGEEDPDGLPGQLMTETVPDVGGTGMDQVTTYKYTENGQRRASPVETIYKDAAGVSRSSYSHYDVMGRLLSSTDADNRTVWYRYDAQGRQTLTVYKWVNGAVDGTPETYTENHYDCCKLLWSRDENGHKTYYGYDDTKRLEKTWTDEQGGESYTGPPLVEYTYDAFGNQKRVKTRPDANTLRQTVYTYDNLNRVTKIEYPDGIVGSDEFGYGDYGGLLWKKDGNGVVTLYKYDVFHRLTDVYYNYTGSLVAIVYPATPDVSYTYHGSSSQRATMTDASGTSEFVYDAQGRLWKYTPPLGLQTGQYVEYGYNNLGQKTQVKITNGTTDSYRVSYEYYANGWLKNVKAMTSTMSEQTIATYTYDVVGNRSLVTLGNGTSTTYAYAPNDPRYSLSNISHKLLATTLAEFGYTRDDVGNPLSFEDHTGTWGYVYDSMNRLTSATPPPGPLPSNAGGTYNYDWVGNRLNPPADPNPMIYNAADQLTVWPGMYSYDYDDNGALTHVKSADGAVTRQSFTYHPTGLMDQAEFSNETETLTNLWDADEHRVRFSIGQEEEDKYTAVFDVTGGVPAVIAEKQPDNSYVYYIREPGGELIARVSGSHINYYHFDELGSTRVITNDAQPATVTDRFTYDAYGAVLSHNRYAGSIDQPYQYVGRLGYYTHYMQPEFGWLQLGVRFYEPELGRFERRDPIATAEAALLYAGGNPMSYVDPSGLYRKPDEKKCKELADEVAQALYELMKDIAGGLAARHRGQCVDPMQHSKELGQRITHLRKSLDGFQPCRGRKNFPRLPHPDETYAHAIDTAEALRLQLVDPPCQDETWKLGLAIAPALRCWAPCSAGMKCLLDKIAPIFRPIFPPIEQPVF